jgi:hypothetical protein
MAAVGDRMQWQMPTAAMREEWGPQLRVLLPTGQVRWGATITPWACLLADQRMRDIKGDKFKQVQNNVGEQNSQ